MKIAIMQPYLFPYIGYFQLMNAVDKFVIYDDVQYIKNGWINRNNILLEGDKHLFTLSIKEDSLCLPINKRNFSPVIDHEIQNLFKTMTYAYKKAPYFQTVFPFIEKLLLGISSTRTISSNLTEILCSLVEFLHIKTTMLVSSSIKKDRSLRGEQKVIYIVNKLGGDCYINAIGGLNLYSKEAFRDKKISLNFIKSRDIQYKQLNNVFIPNLSIIDVLMFNSKEKITSYLEEYELL